MQPNLIEAIAPSLAPFGLNLIGVASAPDYDARVREGLRLAPRQPRVRSIVVIGNGGGGFWRAFCKHCKRVPSAGRRRDPLDEFTREIIDPVVTEALSSSGASGRLVYPFGPSAEPLSFMDLAAAAGLGSPSLLGVLIHPSFGPWMALRAALLTEVTLIAPRPADGFDPCPTCVERPCLAACPAGAVSFPIGWDIPRCIAHRAASGDCVSRCHARVACVYGPEERYPDDALEYHQRSAWNLMKTAAPPQ